MNDPHVIALWYRIEHGDSVEHGEAQPLERSETGFYVKAEQGRVCFEFKDHYATAELLLNFDQRPVTPVTALITVWSWRFISVSAFCIRWIQAAAPSTRVSR